MFSLQGNSSFFEGFRRSDLGPVDGKMFGFCPAILLVLFSAICEDEDVHYLDFT